jgi:hypothetical protein
MAATAQFDHWGYAAEVLIGSAETAAGAER